MIDNFYDKMLEISNQSHLVICNHEEAEAFSKTTDTDYEKVALEMHKILKPLDRIIIITCGKDPVIVSKYNYEKQSMDYIVKSSVYPVSSDEIVDTNGCGDCNNI
jgi:sugar/nucleoside kinase (ribokinase family)